MNSTYESTRGFIGGVLASIWVYLLFHDTMLSDFGRFLVSLGLPPGPVMTWFVIGCWFFVLALLCQFGFYGETWLQQIARRLRSN